MTRTRNLREEATPAVKNQPANPSKITPKQREFILSLLNERAIDGGAADIIIKQMRISEDPEELGCTKQNASTIISELLDMPKKQRAVEAPESNDEPDVPAGRYAITGKDGTTDFYKIDRPTKGKWEGYVFVKLIVGGGFAGSFDECQRIGRDHQAAVIQQIEDDGPREAAIRYGREIGRCSCCGRTLTDPVSIEAGIGPVCAGRQGWSL